MKPLIVANWKCNPIGFSKAKKLFNSIEKKIEKNQKAEVVVSPPFVFLSEFRDSSEIKLGAQNCFYEKKGSFTGEISPFMLKSLGCKYVILGHSERRRYFSETDKMINKKIKLALKAKLKVILCIGETEKQRREGKKAEVIKNQVQEALKDIPGKEIKNIGVAYEPIWAIGSGESCSVEETTSSILLVRKIISGIYNRNKANKVRILYGGSVTSKNSQQYISKAGTDGLLIGGASLKATEFVKIIKSV